LLKSSPLKSSGRLADCASAYEKQSPKFSPAGAPPLAVASERAAGEPRVLLIDRHAAHAGGDQEIVEIAESGFE
jgi:hypothetical protein